MTGLSFRRPPSASSNVKVLDWLLPRSEGLFNQPIKQFLMMRECPSVESESRLIKISCKVHGGDSPLMCPEQSSLEQGNDKMDMLKSAFVLI